MIKTIWIHYANFTVHLMSKPGHLLLGAIFAELVFIIAASAAFTTLASWMLDTPWNTVQFYVIAIGSIILELILSFLAYRYHKRHSYIRFL